MMNIKYNSETKDKLIMQVLNYRSADTTLRLILFDN